MYFDSSWPGFYKFIFLRNIWKAVSAPMKQYQLLGQYCRTDASKISHRHLSASSPQASMLSWQQYPTENCADNALNKKPLLSSTSVAFQSVRTNVRVHYRPSAWKRYNKHNIERRLSTPGGLEMLWRKVLKGKHQLAVYERILPNTVNGKILPKEHFRYQLQPTIKRPIPKPGLFWCLQKHYLPVYPVLMLVHFWCLNDYLLWKNRLPVIHSS